MCALHILTFVVFNVVSGYGIRRVLGDFTSVVMQACGKWPAHRALNTLFAISWDMCDRFLYILIVTREQGHFGDDLFSKLPVIPQGFCHAPDSPSTGTISRKFGSPCVSWASVPAGFTTPPLPTALLGRALDFLQLQASGCNWELVACPFHILFTSLQILILVFMCCSGRHA